MIYFYYWLSPILVLFFVILIISCALRARQRRRQCHQHHCADVFVVNCNNSTDVGQSPSVFPSSTAPSYPAPQQAVPPTYFQQHYAQNPPPVYPMPPNNAQNSYNPQIK
uniref:Uncharacterized protein n=1 Tax=Steinernema glaseri TaxID=37863 RepID=A0A1I7Z379_9BILA